MAPREHDVNAVRSWLYVPGDRADRLEKAAGRGADALIADLEDAVPRSSKEDARKIIAEWLTTARPDGVEVWVRVNNGEGLLGDDLDAVRDLPIDGVVLAKATLASVQHAAARLDGSGIALGALLETAEGILDARGIAASPSVARLAIGEADLAAELSLRPSTDGREWWPYRAMVVLAASAAAIDPPCAPVFTEIADLDGLRSSTEALLRAGFGSRSAIHPDQVPIINEVFTPTDAEVTAARSLVEQYDAAIASGTGVFVDEKGRMVDEAVVRSARYTLERARPGR